MGIFENDVLIHSNEKFLLSLCNISFILVRVMMTSLFRIDGLS